MSEKAIFLDRDGTLIEDPGYINNPRQVKLLDGTAEALIEFVSMGYKTIVVSNQSGVARGMITEKTLGEIHNRLKQLLAEKGAYLDRIYYCPYHPDGAVEGYREESKCRKPAPGMLLTAAEEMDIDLSQSWMIGDEGRDIEAGLRAGCKTILIERPLLHHKSIKLNEPRPDYKAVNIKEAVNIIKQYHRSIKNPKPHTPNPAPDENERNNPLEQTHQPGSENTNVKTAVTAEIEEPSVPPETEEQKSNDEYETAVYRTEHLLSRILEQLKGMNRADMFGEFSLIRFTAGIVQVIVLFCLVLSILFLMSPSRQDNAVFISLGFAIVLQVMALTLYVMQSRK